MVIILFLLEMTFCCRFLRVVKLENFHVTVCSLGFWIVNWLVQDTVQCDFRSKKCTFLTLRKTFFMLMSTWFYSSLIVLQLLFTAVCLTDLLKSTVKSHPYVILESVSRLREAFDYLTLLPLATADGLLRSIQPLLKLSPTLRDGLVIVLRKAIFSRYQVTLVHPSPPIDSIWAVVVVWR